MVDFHCSSKIVGDIEFFPQKNEKNRPSLRVCKKKIFQEGATITMYVELKRIEFVNDCNYLKRHSRYAYVNISEN